MCQDEIRFLEHPKAAIDNINKLEFIIFSAYFYKKSAEK